MDLAENKSLRQILDWIKLNHSTTFIFNPKWTSNTKSPCHVMSYSGSGFPQPLIEVIGVTDESCSTSSPTWSLEAAGGCCWSCRGMLGSTSNQRYPKFESGWFWAMTCHNVCHDGDFLILSSRSLVGHWFVVVIRVSSFLANQVFKRAVDLSQEPPHLSWC